MDLRSDLLIALESKVTLQELVKRIKKFKEDGGEQSEALKILEDIRQAMSEEASEDIVLELMDFVTGFCSPHMRIW
jgi:hypothetical protein